MTAILGGLRQSILAALLALAPCLALAGPEGAPMRAALLLPHAEDSAWTRLLRQGFAEAARQHGMSANVIIAPDSTAREKLVHAAQNHDLVLVASDALHEALRDNAANFRHVRFGSVDAGIRAPNIMSVTFADEQAAFLAGVCAAMLAKGVEPVIGWLSGMDTPAMRSLFNGYAEGARLAKPGCRIVQAIVGSFNDPVTAAQKTAWLLDRGASVIALAAGGGNGEAAAMLAERGARAIDLDAPAAGIGAITKRADKAASEIVASAAQKNFRGKEIVVYNLENGGVDFILAESSNKEIGPEVKRRLRELRGELANGSIRLRSLRQRTLCDCLD